MPHTLLLRLRAPMQSWGYSSRFSIRDTGKEPTKSGVIGLLCAALGISRDEGNIDNPKFAELTKLKMGIRVLNEGVMQKDYHTAQNVAKADGGKPKDTELSVQWYLSDADFLVGLEGEDINFLNELQEAVINPKWQLFLGRKSFAPALPVHFREGVFVNESVNEFLSSEKLDEILLRYEMELNLKAYKDSEKDRVILEDEAGSEVRQDVPLCFASRRFSIRRVTTDFISRKGGVKDAGTLSYENDTQSQI